MTSGRPEYKGCADGRLGRDHDGVQVGCMSDVACPQSLDERAAVARGEPHGGEPRTRIDIRRWDAEAVAKTGGIHNLDIAARRRRRDTTRCRLQFAFAGE